MSILIRLCLLSFLLPVWVSAQTPCNYKKDVDEFSGRPKLSSGFFPVGPGMLSIDATAAEMDYFFVVKPAKGPACFDDESTLTFIFEGGKVKVNGRYTGDANCQGVFHYILKTGSITPSALQKLSTQKLISIMFKGKNEVEYPVTLTPAESQQIQEMSNCIWTASKGLPR